jgi:hypothetical protein
MFSSMNGDQRSSSVILGYCMYIAVEIYPRTLLDDTQMVLQPSNNYFSCRNSRFAG